MSGSEALAARSVVEGAAHPSGFVLRAAIDAATPLDRLAVAHHACRTLASVGAAARAQALRELAEAFREIYRAAFVVIDWFEPSRPVRGSSPADAQLDAWWAPWQSHMQAAEAPVTTLVIPPADRVGVLSEVRTLVVIDLGADGVRGAVGIAYRDDASPSEQELTCLAILGGHLSTVLAHAAPDRQSPRSSGTRTVATDELVGLAAHELRTPLTPITMLLQSLERKGKAGAVDLDAIGRTRRQVNRLTKMIADLLDLSRLRRDRLALSPEPLPLAQAITEAVGAYRETEPKNAIDVVVGDEPLTVFFDRERFRQSLTAWLEHVARVSPGGTAVGISIERRGRFATVQVRGENPHSANASSSTASTASTASTGREPPTSSSLALAVHLSEELLTHHGGSLSIDGICGERLTARLPLHDVATP